MNELALFAGAGGGILGGKLLGWRTVCAVEWEPYPASVLCARQNEGILPPFPIWDDVQTFDGRPWRGRVDVVSGGFPCQDISSAGRGAGIEGSRSGMWRHMARIIGEVRPRFAFIENSPLLRTRGLATVLKDLAEMGYDARWGVLGAHHAGAPHKRDRMWIVGTLAHAPQLLCDGGNDYAGIGARNESLPEFGNSGWAKDMAHAMRSGQSKQGTHWFSFDPAEKGEGETNHAFTERVGNIWGVKSPLGRVANGVANRVDRLKAIGNGQVPAVAALAWELLSN
jgi:DNA (cytosine-5)-methyltransferase 1